MEIKRVARVVVLVEMSDGEIRAIDGTGNVEIAQMRDEQDFEFNMFENPKFHVPSHTEIRIDLLGPWKLYSGRYPEQPKEAQEIEERKQLETIYEPEPGDRDFEW